jgi:hypothetical protein
MSVELANETGVLDQVASNGGFSDLVAASKGNRVLEKFFGVGATDSVEAVRAELLRLEGEPDVEDTARAMAEAMKGQELVYLIR